LIIMTVPVLGTLRCRKALSIVVTTLIILVFSVLLALTAISYTNGLTRARMTSTGQEEVRFYKKHAWVEPLPNGTDRSVTAFKLHNLGGKSISAQLIDVRGTEMDWSDVFFHHINKTTEASLLYSDLGYFDWSSLTGSWVLIDGYNYTQATGNIWVGAGRTLIVYIKTPEVIFRDNIGQPMTLGIATVNANFITELVIESAD